MAAIYIFSGLGTDERVFQYIDFSGLSVHYIQWIPPLSKETIHAYAKRLAGQIHFQKPIFIGVSFGGIMAVEVATLVATEKIILIASVKTKHEIPFYYRAAGALNLHKLLPAHLLTYPNVFAYWLFGIKKQQDKNLLRAILRDTDEDFLKWAIDQVVKWQNEDTPTNLVRLHGTADRIFPYRYLKDAIPVRAGGHFMTVNKAAILTNLLRNLLSATNMLS